MINVAVSAIQALHNYTCIYLEPCPFFVLPSHKVSSARDREQDVYVSSEGQNEPVGAAGSLLHVVFYYTSILRFYLLESWQLHLICTLLDIQTPRLTWKLFKLCLWRMFDNLISILCSFWRTSAHQIIRFCCFLLYSCLLLHIWSLQDPSFFSISDRSHSAVPCIIQRCFGWRRSNRFFAMLSQQLAPLEAWGPSIHMASVRPSVPKRSSCPTGLAPTLGHT